MELKIPEGYLVEFKRDVVKEHTGLSYGRQVKGLRKLKDRGVVEIRFYTNVREIPLNYDNLLVA